MYKSTSAERRAEERFGRREDAAGLPRLVDLPKLDASALSIHQALEVTEKVLAVCDELRRENAMLRAENEIARQKLLAREARPGTSTVPDMGICPTCSDYYNVELLSHTDGRCHQCRAANPKRRMPLTPPKRRPK